MPLFLYRCPIHGDFDSLHRGDSHDCLQGCGMKAQRVWRLKIDATSARHRGRWDPQVGAYVESERQFRNLLREGQDAQSAKLGVDCKLATVDARDSEGLAELHGWKKEDREADLEGTRKLARARKDT
jgi:hypothetical protein